MVTWDSPKWGELGYIPCLATFFLPENVNKDMSWKVCWGYLAINKTWCGQSLYPEIPYVESGPLTGALCLATTLVSLSYEQWQAEESSTGWQIRSVYLVQAAAKVTWFQVMVNKRLPWVQRSSKVIGNQYGLPESLSTLSNIRTNWGLLLA